MVNFKRRKIRLKNFEYKTGFAYFVTINTFENKKYFNNYELANTIKDELILRNSKGEINLLCYCIMPDHIHLLFSLGDGYNKSLSNWVSAYKRFTTRTVKLSYNIEKLWQVNYYDHIVRKEESLQNISDYILQNPVRKEMVQKWQDYPFCGVIE